MLGTPGPETLWAAVAAIAAAGIIALVVYRLLITLADFAGDVLHGIGAQIEAEILVHRLAEDDPWVCRVCRSVNMPRDDACYRGCGLREEIEATTFDGGPAAAA